LIEGTSNKRIEVICHATLQLLFFEWSIKLAMLAKFVALHHEQQKIGIPLPRFKKTFDSYLVIVKITASS